MDLTIFNYFAILGATYFTLKFIIQCSKLNNKKPLPPSPHFSLPIIGNLYLLKKPLYRSLAQISARYGPILYLKFGARNVLLVSSPSTVRESLVHNDVFVDRPRLLPSKHQLFNNPIIAWAPYGDHWRNLRRIAAIEILSPQRLQILSGIRAEVARSFILRMMKEAQKGNGFVEMKSALFGLTLDNMMRMLVGKSNYDEEEDKHGIQVSRSFQELVEETFRASGVSNMEDFLPFLKWFRIFTSMTSSEEKMKKLNNERERNIYEKVYGGAYGDGEKNNFV